MEEIETIYIRTKKNSVIAKKEEFKNQEDYEKYLKNVQHIYKSKNERKTI